jgi:hypothetical protein
VIDFENIVVQQKSIQDRIDMLEDEKSELNREPHVHFKQMIKLWNDHIDVDFHDRWNSCVRITGEFRLDENDVTDEAEIIIYGEYGDGDCYNMAFPLAYAKLETEAEMVAFILAENVRREAEQKVNVRKEKLALFEEFKKELGV